MNINEEFVNWELTQLLPKVCYPESRFDHIAWVENKLGERSVESIRGNNVHNFTWVIRDAWQWKDVKVHLAKEGYKVICRTTDDIVFTPIIINLHTKEKQVLSNCNSYRACRDLGNEVCLTLINKNND